jgi:DNA-binding LacI/PurR family transcriptional regulator
MGDILPRKKQAQSSLKSRNESGPMLSVSRKQKLIDHLRKRIHRGDFKPGDRLSSTEKLAEQFGISVPTAHAALKELHIDGLLIRSRGKGTVVANGKAMTHGRSVGILQTPDNSYGRSILSALILRLQSLDIRVTTYDRDDFFKGPRIPEADRHAAMVVIVHGGWDTVTFQKTYPGVPAIMFSDDYRPPLSVDSIAPNFYTAAFEGTRHLALAGRRRIACCTVFNPFGNRRLSHGESYSSMVEGYEDAILACGLEHPSICRLTVGAEGLDVLRKFLQGPDRPTAMVCRHDHRAVEVLRVARELGLKVPADLALVSIGNTEHAAANNLTSFDLREATVVSLFVETIERILHAPQIPYVRRHYLIEPRLVVRGSCGHTPKPEKKDAADPHWQELMQMEYR